METKTKIELQLSGTQITKNEVNEINAKTIQQIHNDALSKDTKISDNNVQALIDILGGADNILSHCIASAISSANASETDETNDSNPSFALSSSQLNAIHCLLTNPTPNTNSIQPSLAREITMASALHSPRPEDFTHYLSTHNTILHKCTNQQTGHRILRAIYNTKWVAFIALCSFVFLVYDAAFHSGVEWFHMYRAILFPIVNLWLISVCFTVNRRAFALIIRSFEFWLKVGECLLYVLCDIFILFVVRTWTRSSLEAWIYLQFLVLFLLTIITFSLLDAIRMSARKKFALGVVVALITTFQAWLASSFAWNDDVIEIGPFTFKLSGFMSGGIRTLAIFVWKQTVFSYVSSNKFLTVGHKPYVVWIDESLNEQVAEQCIAAQSPEPEDDGMHHLPTI
eukprot:31084_1